MRPCQDSIVAFTIVGELADVVLQRRRVGAAVLDAVAQLAVGVEIEGGGDLSAADDDHAARAQRMAHAELIPDIGVGEGKVGHHQIGDQQFLEHVGADVARAFFLVRAKDFQAGQFECRPDQLGKYTIEINRVALAIFLDPERHCDKSV